MSTKNAQCCILLFMFINGFRIMGTMKPNGENISPTPNSPTSSSDSGSFRSASSGSLTPSPSDLNSAGTSDNNSSKRKSATNERIHYIPVKSLPILVDRSTTLSLEIEEPDLCGFCSHNKPISDARKSMGEPEVIEAAKKELANRLKSNQDLRVPYENSAWLIRFLRLKNYNVSETYTLILNYYNFKAKNKKVLFDKIDPVSFKSLFEKEIFVIMPNRDQAGRRILIFRAKKWKLKEFKITHLLAVSVLLAEAASYEPVTQVMGVQMIIDMEGFSTRHGWECQKKAEMIMEYIQYASPFKIGKFHIINEGLVVKGLVAVFRLFTGMVVHGKAVFHGSHRNTLYEYIPKEYLPDIYGGSLALPKITGSEWEEILELGSQEYHKIMSYGITSPDAVKEEEATTSDSDKEEVSPKA